MTSKPSTKVPAHPVTIEDDDENLDDLDDVLEQFSRPADPPPSQTQPTATSSTPKPLYGPPRPPSMFKEPDQPEIDADLAAELAAGMEDLMRELAGTETNSALPDDEQQKQMREAWEKLLISDLEGGPSGLTGEDLTEFKGTSGASATATGTRTEAAFQKSIREMMDRLKTTDESLKANASAPSDPLSELLAQLGDVGAAAGEDRDEGDVKAVLETIMSQLMSKEMLYEPLKELDEKYPEYLTQNMGKLSAGDLAKYQKQHALISRVVKIFENLSYSDDGGHSAEVLTLMNEMQTLGSPPTEIMGDLPPGWALGADGMPNMAEGCVIA